MVPTDQKKEVDIRDYIQNEFSFYIRQCCNGLYPNYVRPELLIEKLNSSISASITVDKLFELAAEIAGGLSSVHYGYSQVATKIAVSSLHRNTHQSLYDVARILYENRNRKTGAPAPLIATDVYTIIENNAMALDSALKFDRDFQLDYFGFKILEEQYLLRVSDRPVERPQHMFLRVALGIHKEDLAAVIETYEGLSQRYFTHGSATLRHAGTPRPFLSSCFLSKIPSDSISGIYDSLRECAVVAQHDGGVGLAVHEIRANGSTINNGSESESKGLVPVLRLFDQTARFMHLQGRRRNALAAYLEPWHSDVLDVLGMRRAFGREDSKSTRDLYTALWIPDLFMKRVEADGDWSLFCPNEAPGLSHVWGDDFDKLYGRYEQEGRARRTISAQKLWFRILQAQVDTGTPFMVYKDSVNRKSNQQNLGTIQGGSLNGDVVQFTEGGEMSACPFASIALPRFVKLKPDCVPRRGGVGVGGGAEIGMGIGIGKTMLDDTPSVFNTSPSSSSSSPFPTPLLPPPPPPHPKPLVGSLEAFNRYFDLEQLIQVVGVVTRNLNRVIDVSAYPSQEAADSNRRHRPIGIGVQGLAETFQLLGLSFDSDAAAKWNRQIMEAVYYGALRVSCDLARDGEGPYGSYDTSPLSRGVLQPDFWAVSPSGLEGLANWAKLRDDIGVYGARNSLLVSSMSTARTSVILGSSEGFEPYYSNFYTQRVLGADFTVVNPNLIEDLAAQGLWSLDLKEELIAANGSVQDILAIPPDLRNLYKTVWEIKQRVLVDLAVDRGPYVDQSQALNVYMSDPTFGKLSSLHFYTWRKGLKTGMRFLRTRAVSSITLKIALDPKVVERMKASAARRAAGVFAVPPPPSQIRNRVMNGGGGGGGGIMNGSNHTANNLSQQQLQHPQQYHHLGLLNPNGNHTNDEWDMFGGSQTTDDGCLNDDDGASDYSVSQKDSQAYKRAFGDDEDFDESWGIGSRIFGGSGGEVGRGRGLYGGEEPGEGEEGRDAGTSSMATHHASNGFGNVKRNRTGF